MIRIKVLFRDFLFMTAVGHSCMGFFLLLVFFFWPLSIQSEVGKVPTLAVVSVIVAQGCCGERQIRRTRAAKRRTFTVPH